MTNAYSWTAPEEARPVVDLLQAEIPGLQAVYLYGSGARGELRADSDLDFAVIAADRLSARNRWDLVLQLGEITQRDVDLVDLRAVGLPLAAQVLETGRLLFVADAVYLARFENVLMSRWCAFNEERRDLVDDIVARGSIYGG